MVQGSPVHLSTVLAPLVLGLARSTPASAAYVQGAELTRYCPSMGERRPSPPHRPGTWREQEVGPYDGRQKSGCSP